jgi:hypothetical protein
LTELIQAAYKALLSDFDKTNLNSIKEILLEKWE